MRKLAFIPFALIAACTPYDPNLGPAPFLCGPADQSQRCPEGYFCMTVDTRDVCLSPNGTLPPDASEGSCNNDSPLEPNDTLETAYQTAVATQKLEQPFAGLAICPGTDKDNYAITITTQGQNLEFTVDWEPDGAKLQTSILSAGGIPIANGSPVGELQRKAMVAGLQPGVYYGQVYSDGSGAMKTNNYRMNIKVTGP